VSGLVKGIKKSFKRISKSGAGKILGGALALGAIVFTGGAALGLPAMAGGWGGAVSSGLGALGLSGTGAIGSALTGAVTQAGYGALIGGAASLATGGEFLEGAAQGAMAGAVTGGVTGAFSGGGGLMPTETISSMSAPVAAGTPVAGGAPVTAGMANAAGVAAPATGGLMSGILKSPVTGQVIAGLGQGLMTGMAAKEQASQDKAEREALQASYEVDPASLDATTDQYSQGRYTSAEEKYTTRPRYQYNPQTRQIEYS
jgi:hypothetical protein